MKQSHIRKILVCLLLLCALPIGAQPIKGPQTPLQTATQQALQTFAELRQQTQDLERKDARAAIDQYQKFYEEKAYQYPGAGLEISSLIARLYYVELHDKAKSLQIYDWALETFKGVAGYEKLWKEREQIQNGTLSPDAVKIEAASASNAAPDAVKAPVKSAPSTLWGAGLKPVQIGAAPWQKWDKTTPTANAILPSATLPNATLPNVTLPSATLPNSTLPPAALLAVPSLSKSTVAAIGENALHQAILTQLKADTLMAEEAWKSYNLTTDIVLSWINSKTLKWNEDDRVSNELLEQVDKHEPQKLSREALCSLSLEARVRVGEFFSIKDDVRAEDVFKDVMNEPSKTPGALPEWYGPAGSRLASFYEHHKQPQRALETYLEVVKKLPATGGYGVYPLMDAARLCMKLGDEAKAQDLFAQVPKYGDKWSICIALLDQADALYRQQRITEARALLLRPVAGLENDIAQALLWARISYYSAQNGDFQDSQLYADKAMTLYEKRTTTSEIEHLRIVSAWLNIAKDFIKMWKEPILCETQLYQKATVITKTIQTKPQEPLLVKVIVRTFFPVSLDVSCDDAQLKITLDTHPPIEQRMERERRIKDSPLRDINQVVLEIPTERLDKDFETTMTVSSSKVPACQVRIPIKVRVMTQK